MYKENIIAKKTYSFSVRIVKLYQKISYENNEYVLSKQLLKSGTSIGANTEEAIGGISKKDFIAKFYIAYKEARETKYWLRLLNDTGYINNKLFESLVQDCEEILKILFSIIRSAKNN